MIDQNYLKLCEIRRWFRDINFIITDMNISLHNAQRVLYRTDDDEQRIKHRYFSHLPQQMRFILIIHLAKLYGEGRNDKRSLVRLITKLEKSTFDEKLKELLTKNRKKKNTELFTSKSNLIKAIRPLKRKIRHNKYQIDRIIYVRNKSYAHIDPKRRQKYVSYDELQVLVKLANEIFNTISTGLFYKGIAFEMTDEYDINIPLRMIASYYKLMDEKFENH